MNDLNHIYKVGNLICKLREEKWLRQAKEGLDFTINIMYFLDNWYSINIKNII